MITAEQAAAYFLVRADADEEGLTLLKLQKLLYYAQGFSLALFHGAPLFDEPILAWEHGPVVRSIWDVYSDYRGGRQIELQGAVDMEVYTDGSGDFLDEVWQAYGQFSAWKLREMTHEEAPWLQTPRDSEIPRELMQEFFTAQL
jgi:uncharacterized phage-associated protein